MLFLMRLTFLGVRLLTQSIATTIKEALLAKAVIGPPCVLQADSYQGNSDVVNLSTAPM